MDRETIGKVKSKLEEISEKENVDLSKIIVFGSRASDNYREKSDVDILIVSTDFEGKMWYERPGIFYRYWDYENLPEPEFICLTPQEFAEKKVKKPHIVRTATKEGVRVT